MSQTLTQAWTAAPTAVYVEFVLLARTADGWRITGTLWQWTAGHGPRAR
jgi:hypothetical protein